MVSHFKTVAFIGKWRSVSELFGVILQRIRRKRVYSFRYLLMRTPDTGKTAAFA